MTPYFDHGPEAAPHNFARKGWRWWLCRHCYAPRGVHPRVEWVRARPVTDNRYLSANAPHFHPLWRIEGGRW